jgi:hypothetical protein
MPLLRVSAESEGSRKVLMCELAPSSLPFKLAKGCMIKRVLRQTI